MSEDRYIFTRTRFGLLGLGSMLGLGLGRWGRGRRGVIIVKRTKISILLVLKPLVGDKQIPLKITRSNTVTRWLRIYRLVTIIASIAS